MKNVTGLSLLTILFLSACTGTVDPGQTEQSSPTSAITTDPGTGGATPLAPVINMVNLRGGDYVPGGATYNIYYSVHDTSIGFNQSTVEYQKDGDTTWKTIAARVATVNDVEVTVPWPVCPQVGLDCSGVTDGNGYRIRITAVGVNNLTSSVISASTFTIDSSPPILSQHGLQLAALNPTIHQFMNMTLTGVTDTGSPVKDVCVKALDSTAPSSTDPCWTSIAAYGVAKALAPAPITITQYMGFFGGTYDFYLWARDSANNMTLQTSNNNGLPGQLVFQSVQSGLCLTMVNPLTSTNGSHFTQQACDGSDSQKFNLHILANGWYTLQNVASGSCLDDAAAAGDGQPVHQWTCDPTNANQWFRFGTTSVGSVMITNPGYCVSTVGHSSTAGVQFDQMACDTATPTDVEQNFVVTAVSGSLNPDPTTGLGNPNQFQDKLTFTYTAPAVDSSDHYISGTSAYWQDNLGSLTFATTNSGALTYTNSPSDDATTLSDPGSLVVTAKGIAYIKDQALGIVKLDLVNQVRSIFVPKASTYQTGTTGAGATASLKNPLRIALGDDDSLWIQDESEIAKVDSTTGIMTTMIGGGSVADDTAINATDVQIAYSANLKWYGTFAVYPNDVVLFNSEDPHRKLNPASNSDPRYRLRVYTGSTGIVSSIYFSGIPDGATTGTAVGEYDPYGSMGFTFDGTRGFINSITGRFCTGEAAGACNGQLSFQFDSDGSNPVTISTLSQFSNQVTLGSLDTVYAFNSEKGILSSLDSSTNTWTKTLGGTIRPAAATFCLNASSSSSCNVSLTDVYITKDNRVFFLDNNQRLRSVEINGRVHTLYDP